MRADLPSDFASDLPWAFGLNPPTTLEAPLARSAALRLQRRRRAADRSRRPRWRIRIARGGRPRRLYWLLLLLRRTKAEELADARNALTSLTGLLRLRWRLLARRCGGRQPLLPLLRRQLTRCR